MIGKKKDNTCLRSNGIFAFHPNPEARDTLIARYAAKCHGVSSSIDQALNEKIKSPPNQ